MTGVRSRVAVAAAVAGLLVCRAPLAASRPGDDGLSVLSGGQWQSWWTPGRAPARWTAALPALAKAVQWDVAAPELSWGSFVISGPGEARRTRVVVVRLDPARYEFQLDFSVRYDTGTNQWTVDAVPPDAALAFNAGQFTGVTPWGWVVHGGRELRPPATGPLSMAVLFDASGSVALVPGDGIPAARQARMPREAFQSYPMILTGAGDVPRQISAPNPDVKWGHRDARLALGRLRDGQLLLALTRFDGLGEIFDRIPLGLTLPEMSAVMGALGCESAVMLDGGLSAQVMVRAGEGTGRQRHAWPGTRRVPMGLFARPR